MPGDSWRYTSADAYDAEFLDEPNPLVGVLAVRWPEDQVPQQARWWIDRSWDYVESKESEWGKAHAAGIWSALRRFQYGLNRTRRRKKCPGVFERAGIDPIPETALSVTAAHVAAVRDCPEWSPKTRSFYLQALRGFLRHYGNPVAEERRLWAIDSSALQRRWLTREQLGAVWEVCRDDYDRLVVAATGFNGLRRIEVLRLRGRDVTLAVDRPEARIWGKGSHGGKYRTIPVSAHLYGALVSLNRTGNEPFFPWKQTSFDLRLSVVGKLAGLPSNLSGHTLRRTFGRIAYYAGVPLVSIQGLYGHASPAMTSYYIGLDATEQAAGLALFERAMAAEPGV
jgi:integrase